MLPQMSFILNWINSALGTLLLETHLYKLFTHKFVMTTTNLFCFYRCYRICSKFYLLVQEIPDKSLPSVVAYVFCFGSKVSNISSKKCISHYESRTVQVKSFFVLMILQLHWISFRKLISLATNYSHYFLTMVDKRH